MSVSIIEQLSLLKSSPFLLLFVLIGAFELSLWLRQTLKQPLINPTLLTTVAVILFLKLSDVSWEVFNQASGYLSFWLQPVVVCMAVPLYVQWQKIRAQWLPIMVSQLIGSVVGIVSGVGLVRLLGGAEDSMVAIAAKSVTMPIAIEVTDVLGGVVGISAATVLVAGVTGQVMGVYVLHQMRARRSMAQGLSLGTASHALGTARAMQMGSRHVAYATVGLILNGILTAFLAPVIVPFLLP
ncbi:murein hydrolase transporter LrgB [Moraxella bovoculi]|uniref:LrgB family protein n=1 Tax=Moraxella bovoculi TaxID=386891 RepID=UPI000624D985|nr:LrgB family protein [Moraxella bovoculi]AKG16219.2 murein hydrolase transporter LrgB [Moraxella bovoculi]AKG18537.1 murein hydrolase transporter LrgB [Moraxella bovoculi]